MDRLESLLEEKTGLLREMLAETRLQGERIAASDPDGLLALLDRRQALMARIDGLNQRIGAAKGPEGREAQAQRRDQEQLLGDIRAMDGENRRAAQALMETFAEGIRQTRAEQTLLAYADAGGGGNRYVNRRG